MSKNLSVTITDFYYQKSEGGHLVQGVKRNRTPKHAVAGGNGSFIVNGEPPKIILNLEFSNGSKSTYDIYSTVKEYTPRTRITEKYANEICNYLLDETINIPNIDKKGNSYLFEQIDEIIERAIDNIG